MLGFLKTTSKYPTEWEEQDPVNLERIVERKKYVIKLDTGEEIVTEADYVRTSGNTRYFHDTDMVLTTGYNSPQLTRDKDYHHLEINNDEVAAIRNETVATRKYKAENVKYETRKKKEPRYRMPGTTRTEVRIISNREVEETRQIGTE